MNRSLLVAILESVKKDEYRIPLHPDHIKYINKKKNHLIFQENYGKGFGLHDKYIQERGYSTLPRDMLLNKADIVFLLKPQPEDLMKMKKGAILVGWCHVVQQITMAKIAMKNELTIIAMESMYRNNRKEHLFYENNYLAGSLGVEHALNNTPYVYSKNAKISIITYGAVSQGAVKKLLDLGFTNITVYSRRKISEIFNQHFNVTYKYIVDTKGQLVIYDTRVVLRDELLNSDIIVNGVMQNVLSPYQFFSQHELISQENKLIIDLSCDDHMGFDFAVPTTVQNPIMTIGKNFYYAVDNVPSLAWKEITLPISTQLCPIINNFLNDMGDASINKLVSQATEISKGDIINKIISQYQELYNLRSVEKLFL